MSSIGLWWLAVFSSRFLDQKLLKKRQSPWGSGGFFNKKAILHWFLAIKSCKNPNNCRGAAKQWALRAQIRSNGVKKQATKGNSYVGALSILAWFPEEEEGETRKL